MHSSYYTLDFNTNINFKLVYEHSTYVPGCLAVFTIVQRNSLFLPS